MTLASGLPPTFFAEHWQRRPVLLPGFAAVAVPDLAADPSGLRSTIESHPASRGDGATVWFLERVRHDLAEVARLCTEAARVFAWDDVWCDLFATRGRASIGRHFDDSDNTSIQLAGTKQWRLRPPATIAESARWARAIGEPDVGGLPDGTSSEDHVYHLGPGDALYIPSMWSHEGVSDGDSVSVSLVVNVATVLHALLPELMRHLRTSARWTQVLATGPESAGRRRAQFDAVTGPAGGAEISAALHVAADAFGTSGSSPRPEPPGIQLGIDWLREYVAAAPAVPTEGLVLLDRPASAAISALAARRTAKRFAKALIASSARTEERRARAVYAAVAAMLPRLAPVELDRLFTDPDVTSWTDEVMARPESPHRVRSTIDAGVDVLATAVLPELAAHHPGPPLLIHPPADIDGAVTLRRLTTRVDASAGSRPALLVGDGTVRAVGHAALSGIGEQLPAVGGVVISRAASQWLADRMPAAAGSGADDDGASWPRRVAALQHALELLDEVYPEAAAVFRTTIRSVVAPQSPAGADGLSTPAFRGLIVVGDRSPSQLAVAIAQETARNRVNSLLEVVPVGAEQQLIRDAVVLSQQVHLAHPSRGADGPAADQVPRAAERAAGHVVAALREATLTPTGRRILEQTEQILAAAAGGRALTTPGSARPAAPPSSSP